MGRLKRLNFRLAAARGTATIGCAGGIVGLGLALIVGSAVATVAPVNAETVLTQGADGGFNSRQPNAAPGGGSSGYGGAGKHHGVKPGPAPADPGPNPMDRDEGFDTRPGCPYSNQKLELIV